MPSKKPKLPKEQLKELVDEHNIKFEGPVPSKQWPSRYIHIFKDIREIGSVRYNDYMRRAGIDQTVAGRHKTRVRDLRSNVARLRMDFNINEETWRESVEYVVFRRFDQEVVCACCKNEIWEPEHNAQPVDDDEREKLERKRARRRRCTCNDGNNIGKSPDEDSDEETQTKIFSTSISQGVSHDPQDKLENSRVPMRPDRVIGLSMNDRYREYIASSPVELSHSPVKGRQIMYPFLVHEAKRERDAPGFRYVEVQTAFPIRRFLNILDELQTASNVQLDPLVWFFANQGEDWRLYAAILDNKRAVRVYHLWYGNLESQDGASQILQIVEFVWTWARDVYRPLMRKCLRGRDDYQREISPTSTNPFTRSQSVFSVPNATSSFQQTLDDMEEDETTSREVVSDGESGFQNASTHPFLNMRHSNIVMFSFRILEIPENHQSFYDLIYSLKGDYETSEVVLHALKVIQQDQYTLPMQRDQIHDLERYWTGFNTQTSYGRSMMSHSDQRIRTFFLFRTFCQQEDWQLKRELYCVVWSPIAASLLSTFLGADIDFTLDEEPASLIQNSEFVRACQPLRTLSGRESVVYALDNTNLILLPCDDTSESGKKLQWRQPQNQGIQDHIIAKSIACFDFALSGQESVQSFHHQHGRLLWVVPTYQPSVISPELISIPDDVGKGGSMLVLKPNAWPQQCPRFCLFALFDRRIQDKSRLGQLLRYAIRERDMYSVFDDDNQEGEGLSAVDMQWLRNWEHWFNE